MAFDFAAVGGVQVIKAGGFFSQDVPMWDFGWVQDDTEVAVVSSMQPYPTSIDTEVARVSEIPSFAFLWKAYEKLFGKKTPARNQGQVGSCVGFGTSRAVETTMCCEIAIGGEIEEFKDISREVTYGGSRVEVGGGRIRGDGSVGAWAAQFVKDWGVVAMGKYSQYDLSQYSESTCRLFGDQGVPAEIETLAKAHPVKSITKVTSVGDAQKMLASGYGMAVCSNQGFTMQRDANGVCKPSGNWAHCMAIDGYYTDANGRLYFHIVNSWGDNAHTGPVGWGDPGTDGFWADAATVGRMIDAGDTWAFASVQGFPARKIDWSSVL